MNLEVKWQKVKAKSVQKKEKRSELGVYIHLSCWRPCGLSGVAELSVHLRQLLAFYPFRGILIELNNGELPRYPK